MLAIRILLSILFITLPATIFFAWINKYWLMRGCSIIIGLSIIGLALTVIWSIGN